MADEEYTGPTTADGKPIMREIEVVLFQPFSFGKDRCEVVNIRLPKYTVIQKARTMRTEDDISRLDHIVMNSSNILGTELPVTPDMYDFMSAVDVGRLQGAASYFLDSYADQLVWASRVIPTRKA